MLSIGTLIAYTMVAIAVLLTRYQPGVESVTYEEEGTRHGTQKWLKKLCCAPPNLEEGAEEVDYQEIKNQDLQNDAVPENEERRDEPTVETSYRASMSVALLTFSITGFCIIITAASSHLYHGEAWAIFLACLAFLMVVASLMGLLRQPRNTATFPFTVPCVPVLPIAAIFVNVLLLVTLNHWTYLRFAVWMALGKHNFT